MPRLIPVLLLVLAIFSGFVPTSSAQSPEWLPFEQALAEAERNGSKVMVDIYAPWCPWCQRLQSEVYVDDQVLSYLNEHFQVTRLNIDDEEATVNYEDETFSSPEMAVFLGAQGVPTVAFLDSEGDYLTHLPGFVESDEFLLVLQFVNTEAFREMTYMEFVEQQSGE